MKRVISRSLRYNWDSHCSTPANLWAATLGMVFNNVFFIFGAWMMLFAGKDQNSALLPYFLALNGIVAAAWGAVCFFAGGLRSLGELVDEGQLEPMLATPRDPLFLAALSRSHPSGLGDMIQGFGNFILLAAMGHGAIALRCLPATLISMVGFASVFTLAGAISFYVQRGANAGGLLIESTVSLSSYPTGKLFPGPGRFLLYLTPAAATGILPGDAAESGTPQAFALALLAVGLLAALSGWMFKRGLRRYRSLSLVGARE